MSFHVPVNQGKQDRQNREAPTYEGLKDILNKGDSK